MNLGELLRDLLLGLEVFVGAYFVFVNGLYAMLLTSAAHSLRIHRRRAWHQRHWRLLSSEIAPRLSILAPAHNEVAGIVESVRALLTLRYPNLEVVVINDGSADATFELLEREFALRRHAPVFERLLAHAPLHGVYRSRRVEQLVVVDKQNGGKADALNAGLNVATGDLACAVDADTLIEPDALLRLVQPFIERDDVVAAGGTIRVANGCRVRQGRVVERRAPRRALPGAQAIEYVRAFLFGRLGWNSLGGNLIISGAFGLFDRDAVVAAGGYLEQTVGEDIELVVRLRRRAIEREAPSRVVFVPDPVAWTEVPTTFRVLGRQRDRWHRGLADTVWRHRGLMFNPRYGSLGTFVYPYFVLVELLAPVIEAVGLLVLPLALALGAINWQFALILLLVTYGLALVLTACSLLLEEYSGAPYAFLSDRMRLIPWVLIESFGYRQLTVVWRLRGLWRYLRGQAGWGVMTRTGFEPAETGPSRK